MSALEKMREAFDECTVMAGVEPDFECVYITKDAANALLKEAEDENDELKRLVRDLHKALFSLDIDHCQACPRDNINGPCTKHMICGSDECSIEGDMRKLEVEVDK